MVVMKGSHKVGVASVGASPWGLPHPWEPVGWPDSQEGWLSLDMNYVLPIGGGILTLAPKGLG
jgi:hypothetical protein